MLSIIPPILAVTPRFRAASTLAPFISPSAAGATAQTVQTHSVQEHLEKKNKKKKNGNKNPK
jgi:hypothetical protein